jgi:SAM-dependent methyltransferase
MLRLGGLALRWRGDVARIDRQKRALGGAVKRTRPSHAASVLVARELARGRVLDFGCGYGLDAATFGWDAYDPYYRPAEPGGPYDTIVCTLVLSALSRRNRALAVERIRGLLAEDGHAYLGVARDLPEAGKLGMHHSFQSYVALTLPLAYEDERIAIYDLTKVAAFEDRTRDYLSRRDRRLQR